MTPPSGTENTQRVSKKYSIDHKVPQKAEKSFIDPQSYQKAEIKANWYFAEINQLANSSNYLVQLSHDYRQWASSQKENGTKVNLSELESKQQLDAQLDTWSFLQKLEAEQKLKQYLTKSISYIFMRDLGKSLDDKSTRTKIDKTVKKLHRWIKKQTDHKKEGAQQLNNQLLYKKAKDLGIESTLYWLMSKLASVQLNMPQELDKKNGLRKLVKIIAGVVLHQFVDSDLELTKKERAEKVENAIRLGYSYGLTYPFVDDLQDSATALSAADKDLFNQAIRKSLIAGEVIECPTFSPQNQNKMSFIYQELSEAFNNIKLLQSEKSARQFFEQAFIFFEAQDIDRSRRLQDKEYAPKDIYIPLILKSAGCRLIAREIVDCEDNERFDYRTFCFGIYNQFNDDIKDIFDDLEEGNVTPYTHFLTNTKDYQTKELTNPYRIYWAVVSYLIKEVYKNNAYCRQLLLERSINAHKSLLSIVGDEKYQWLKQKLLHTGAPEFDKLISQLVEQPNDVAWFDKLVSRQVAEYFDNSSNAQDTFKEKFNAAQGFVEKNLALKAHNRLQGSTLVDAANYSVMAGGKRLRSVLAYIMCKDKYNMRDSAAKNVIQLLEYMHTASIIFDDKPSQDDSDTRRGKPALHKAYNCEATAELAGVFLMMRAVEVQSQIKGIDPQCVLESLAYAANTTQAICEGQLMDLKSSQYKTDLKQLETLSHLKTGLAIEAALMIPAILANENDIEKEHIKQFSKHLGLAFQIKDDLLDYTSSDELLGKPILQDKHKQKASFVTYLGIEGAQEKLYYHYFKAQESVEHLGKVKNFMNRVLDFVIYRQM
ncbi:MAG: polyprenyl synthetase family protein [Kangiellaceae bacterium]|nr:polyprenyl synthetase family protein [Kangiellaceae bacterium]MCW8999797.1 polyprenyl synthetase family protein [Kangiellaceae bacterium]